MALPARPVAFVLASTNHGTMIVNRNDYCLSGDGGIGVGYQILNNSGFDEMEVHLCVELLRARREAFGDGVIAIDGGANIGVHTVEWARNMNAWGSVISFEAQEHVYYALAGNIAINNCLNVRAHWAALGEKTGTLAIPQVNPRVPASFGSLELRPREKTEYIGQEVSYLPERMTSVALMTIDKLELERLDFLKLDVEGMEADVLNGAMGTITRHLPIMVIEVLKSEPGVLDGLARGLGYETFPLGINILAIHKSDPTLQRVKIEGESLHFAPVIGR